MLIFATLINFHLYQSTYIARISKFELRCHISDLGGFWDEKSRGAKIFAIGALLTPTGPLLKIGGQNDFFDFMLNRYKMTLNDLK